MALLLVRPRQENETLHQWLLSPAQQINRASFGLKGCLVRGMPDWTNCGGEIEFDARKPPRILTWFNSLNALVDSNFTCWVEPNKVKAPMKTVWNQIIDVDKYSDWNPYHRGLAIVENAKGDRFVRMRLALSPNPDNLEASRTLQVAEERVLYVDERENCCIFMYSYEGFFVNAVRVQVVEAINEHECIYYSYDAFGGWLAKLLIYPFSGYITSNFVLAAKCLKKRCESLQH